MNAKADAWAEFNMDDAPASSAPASNDPWADFQMDDVPAQSQVAAALPPLSDPGPRGRRISAPSPHTVPATSAPGPTGMLGGLMEASGQKMPEYHTNLTDSLVESLSQPGEAASGADTWGQVKGTAASILQSLKLGIAEQNMQEIEQKNTPIPRDALWSVMLGHPAPAPSQEQLDIAHRDPRYLEEQRSATETLADAKATQHELAAIAERNPDLLARVQLGLAGGTTAAIPTLATAFATKSLPLTAAVAFPSSYLSSYAPMRAADVPVDKAQFHSLMEGVIGTVANTVPMGQALKFGTPLAKRVINTIAAAVPTASAATIASEINNYAASLPGDMTVDDWKQAVLKGVVKLPETWATAMIQSAGLATAGHLLQKPPASTPYKPGASYKPEFADLMREGAGAETRKAYDKAYADAQNAKSNVAPGPIGPDKMLAPPASGSPSPGPSPKASAPIGETGQGPASTPAPVKPAATEPKGQPAAAAPAPAPEPLTTAPSTPVVSETAAPSAPPAPPVPKPTPLPQTEAVSSAVQEPPAGGADANARKEYAAKQAEHDADELDRQADEADSIGADKLTTQLRERADKTRRDAGLPTTARAKPTIAPDHWTSKAVTGEMPAADFARELQAQTTRPGRDQNPDWAFPESVPQHLDNARKSLDSAAKWYEQYERLTKSVPTAQHDPAFRAAIRKSAQEVEDATSAYELQNAAAGLAYNLAGATQTLHRLTPEGKKQLEKAQKTAEKEGKKKAEKAAKQAAAVSPSQPVAETSATTATPVREPTGGDQVHPQAYGSGLSRRGDLRGGMESKIGVGTTISELSDGGMDDVATGVAAGKDVFVDSGAFSAFRAAIKAGRPNETEMDFTKVIERYNKLSQKVVAATPNDFGKRGFLTFVAPDVVGNQPKTLALIKKHAESIKGWMEAGHEVIVPFQRGPMKQSDFYNNVAEALGGTDFVVGIPSNAEALSNADFAELVSQPYKPDRLHILGAVNSPRMEERMNVIREHYKDDVPGVTSDANLVRSKMDKLYGLKGKARAEAIRQILNENATDAVPAQQVKLAPIPEKTAKAAKPAKAAETKAAATTPVAETTDEVVGLDDNIGEQAHGDVGAIEGEEPAPTPTVEKTKPVQEKKTRAKGVKAADAPGEDLTEEDVAKFHAEQASRAEPKDVEEAPKAAADDTDPLRAIAARKAAAAQAALDAEAKKTVPAMAKRDTTPGRSEHLSVWQDLAPRPQVGETPEQHLKRVESFVTRMRNAPVDLQIKIVKGRTERVFGFKSITIDPALRKNEAIDQLLDAYNNLSNHSAFTGLPAEAMGFNGDLSLKLNNRIDNQGTRGLFSMKFGQPFGETATITIARRSDSFVHEHMHALDFNLLTRYFLARDRGGLSGKAATGTDLLRQNKADVEEGRVEKLPEPIREAFLEFMRSIYLTDDASINRLGALSLELEANKQALTKAKAKHGALKRSSNQEVEREQRAAALEQQAAKLADPVRAEKLRKSAAAIRARNAALDGDTQKAKAVVEQAQAKVDGALKSVNDLLSSKMSHLAAASEYVDKLRGDDPYFSLATELMARAGESWIGNRVGQQGGTEFLSGRPEYYNENSSRLMRIVYPNPVDRLRINESLEDLFAALTQHQYFSGEVHAPRIPGDTRIDKDLWTEDKNNPTVGVMRKAFEGTAQELKNIADLFAAMKDPAQAKASLKLAGQGVLTAMDALSELTHVYYSGRGRVFALQDKYKKNPLLAAEIKKVGQLVTTDPGTKDVQGVTLEREVAAKAQMRMNRVGRIEEKYDLDINNKEQMRQLHERLVRPHEQVRLELKEALEDVRAQLSAIEGDRNKEVQVARAKQQIKLIEDFLEQYKQPSAPPENIRQAANALGGMYHEIFGDADSAGIKLGYVSNYQRRTLNRDKVTANPKKFVQQAQALYEFEQLRALRRLQKEIDAVEADIKKWRAVEKRTGTELPRVKELQAQAAALRGEASVVSLLKPEDQAEEYLYSARTGEMFRFDAATPTSKFVKERKFGPIADILLADFYDDNPLESMYNYVGISTRRIAYARRFGDDHGKRRVMMERLRSHGMSEPDIDELNKVINHLAGFHSSAISHRQRLALDMLYNSASMGLLPLNLFSQLAEPLAAGLRTGRVRDGLINLGYTIQAVANTGDSAKIAKIADAIGIISRAGHDVIAMSRLDGADMTKMSRKWMTEFQRRTGVHGYTNASRQASMKLGGMYLKEVADAYLSDNIAERASGVSLLNELGIDPVDHERFARYVAARGNLISLEDLERPEDHDLKTQYIYALHGFVDGVIGNPKPSDKQLMAANPVFRFLTALMPFQMYFQRHVLVRHGKKIGAEAKLLGQATLKLAGPGPKGEAAREAADAAGDTAGASMKFLLPLLALMVGTFASTLMKESVFNRKRAKERIDNLASVKTLTDAADLASVTGDFSQLYNYGYPNKYEGRNMASLVAAPYVGRYFDAMDDFRDGWQDRTDPNDTSNSAERRSARAFYRLTVNTALPPLLSGMGLNGFIGFSAQSGFMSKQAQDGFANWWAPPTVSERYAEMQRQKAKEEEFMRSPLERATHQQEQAEDRADNEERMKDELQDYRGVTP